MVDKPHTSQEVGGGDKVARKQPDIPLVTLSLIEGLIIRKERRTLRSLSLLLMPRLLMKRKYCEKEATANRGYTGSWY